MKTLLTLLALAFAAPLMAHTHTPFRANLAVQPIPDQPSSSEDYCDATYPVPGKPGIQFCEPEVVACDPGKERDTAAMLACQTAYDDQMAVFLNGACQLQGFALADYLADIATIDTWLDAEQERIATLVAAMHAACDSIPVPAEAAACHDATDITEGELYAAALATYTTMIEDAQGDGQDLLDYIDEVVWPAGIASAATNYCRCMAAIPCELIDE